MSVRAVILGLLSGAAVCSFCYFNDFVMRQTFLVGNYMPISVYGGLLLFILVVNPILLMMSRRLALTGRELAVIVALTLAACYVPGRGLMHYFSTFLMMPHHYRRTTPGWKEHQVVDRAPPQMLAGVPPTYRTEDLKDALAFTARLAERGPTQEPSPSRFLWRNFTEDERAAVRQARQAARENLPRQERLAHALNEILRRRDFFRARDFEGIELPTRAKELAERRNEAIPAWPLDAVRDRMADLYLAAAQGAVDRQPPRWIAERIDARRGLTDEQVLQLNRSALETAFPKAVATHRGGVYELDSEQVLDWPGFCARLTRLARRGRHNPGKRIWDLLPADARTAVDELLQSARQAEKQNARIVAGLNRIVTEHALDEQPAFQDLALPPQAEKLREAENALSEDERRRLNRHLLDTAFPQGLRSIGATEDTVLNGFLQGLAVGREHIAPSQIPWYAWTRTLKFWLPLLLTFSVGVIGLAVVVHRQWSDHEHLPYPIVTFAHALLPEEGSKSERVRFSPKDRKAGSAVLRQSARGGVFSNRLFWLGAAIILAIHLNNYACQWWPRYLIQVPRRFDFMSLRDVLPRLNNPGHLLNPMLSFTAMGFAYFLATDVSLAVGVAPFAYEWVVGLFAAYGVSIEGGGFISLQIRTFLYGGAYLGMFLVLLYTGRHYYLRVLRQSLFLPGGERVERQAAWGGRVFLAAAAFFAAQLVWVGLPVYLALIYTVGAVLIFTVISRLVAETGVFFIHAYHFPCVLLWGVLGARALGPDAMLIMFMVTALLLIDPREAVMPFMVQGFKLVDLKRVSVGKTAAWGTVALVLAFAVAVPVTLYWQYDRGVMQVGDGWTRGVPRMPFDATVRAMERLKAQGVLQEAGQQSGVAWLRSISPNTPCVVAFGATFALVLLFAAGRLRFPRWPIHPVMFLVLGTFQSRTLAVSFLLGWFIKLTVTKYGGARVYQRLKPLMIGLIAGDLLGGLIPMMIGAIYYLKTGDPPKPFQVLPL